MPMTVNEALQKWWDEDAERLNSMAEQAREFAVKVPKRKSESRAFCPNGEGNGVSNDCSSKDKSPPSSSQGDASGSVQSPEPEDEASQGEPESIKEQVERTSSPFTEGDMSFPRTEITTRDARTIPVITRDDVSNTDYLDFVERSGADRGIVVDFDEAKDLQAETEIDEDIGPYAAFVRDGYTVLAGNNEPEGNTDETIDFNGSEYGTLDEASRQTVADEYLDEIVQEQWASLSDNEIEEEIPGYSELSSDDREVAMEKWLEEAKNLPDNVDAALSHVYDLAVEARLSAIPKMREDLERSLARSTLKCCLQLYRGLRLDASDVEDMISEGFVTHSGTNSWTTSRQTARAFHAGKVLLVLRNPSAGHVYQADHSGEKEVTRPPSKMAIKGVVKTKMGGYVLFLDEDDDYKDDDKDGIVDVYQKGRVL